MSIRLYWISLIESFLKKYIKLQCVLPLIIGTIHQIILFYVHALKFKCLNAVSAKFKLYLFYNDYETSYTTYINHARGTDVCV